MEKFGGAFCCWIEWTATETDTHKSFATRLIERRSNGYISGAIFLVLFCWALTTGNHAAPIAGLLVLVPGFCVYLLGRSEPRTMFSVVLLAPAAYSFVQLVIASGILGRR